MGLGIDLGAANSTRLDQADGRRNREPDASSFCNGVSGGGACRVRFVMGLRRGRTHRGGTEERRRRREKLSADDEGIRGYGEESSLAHGAKSVPGVLTAGFGGAHFEADASRRAEPAVMDFPLIDYLDED